MSRKRRDYDPKRDEERKKTKGLTSALRGEQRVEEVLDGRRRVTSMAVLEKISKPFPLRGTARFSAEEFFWMCREEGTIYDPELANRLGDYVERDVSPVMVRVLRLCIKSTPAQILKALGGPRFSYLTLGHIDQFLPKVRTHEKSFLFFGPHGIRLSLFQELGLRLTATAFLPEEDEEPILAGRYILAPYRET